MKTTINKYFSVLIIGLTLLFAVGCEKSEETKKTSNIYEEFGNFTKEITIYDETKENSAVILVGSDDESILNMWSSENFTLGIIKNEQDAETIVNEYVSKFPVEKNENVDDESDEISAKISIRFLTKDLTADVSNVFLLTNDPYDDDMRGWTMETVYSDRYGSVGQNVNNYVKCTFYGQNILYKGYYKLRYLVNRGDFYTWITNSSGLWEKIRRNEVDVYSRTPCYTMKAERKYKGNPNSVIFVFSY